jgi:hypothetical protein
MRVCNHALKTYVNVPTVGKKQKVKTFLKIGILKVISGFVPKLYGPGTQQKI